MSKAIDKIFDRVYERLNKDSIKYGRSMIYLCNNNLNKEEHNLMVALFSKDFPDWADWLDKSYWGD